MSKDAYNIGVYLVSFPGFSGGIKYFLRILQHLYDRYKDITVSIYCSKKKEIQDPYVAFLKLCERFEIQPPMVKIIPIYSGRGYRFIRFLYIAFQSRKYDLFINASTKAFIPNSAKRGLYICHFPPDPHYSKSENWCHMFPRIFEKIGGNYFRTTWTLYASNSSYPDHWLEKYWNIPEEKRTILYPAVVKESQILVKNQKKKQLIVTVGRIEEEKRQKALAEIFCRYYADYFKDFEFCIVGPEPRSEQQKQYIDEIKVLSEGFPVTFQFNLPQEELWDLYKDSKIYWHARGLEVDEEKDPFHVEHFGMTTAEAMAFGVVPVVIKKGGQKEMVSDDVNGYTWDTLDECAEKTRKALLAENYHRLSQGALNSAHQYTIEKFNERLEAILEKVFQSRVP